MLHRQLQQCAGARRLGLDIDVMNSSRVNQVLGFKE